MKTTSTIVISTSLLLHILVPLFVPGSVLADPIAGCVQGVAQVSISRKPNLPDASGEGTAFSPILAQGVSYVATGGIVLNIQNPPAAASDLPSLLARHIAAMKAQNLSAMKSQFQAGEQAKVDAFLANPGALADFWAAAAGIQECRLFFVRQMGPLLDVWVQETSLTGPPVCVRYAAICLQGQLWMATGADLDEAAKEEDLKLTGFLAKYGISGVDITQQ